MKENKKKELLKLLKKERPKIEKFNHNVFVIEQKKASTASGLLRFEWYINDDMEAPGLVVFPLASSKETQPSTWTKLNVGETEYYAITFDLKAKSISKLIGQFVRRSLEDGRL